MQRMGKAKALAQQIAELRNDAPKDFDPEEDGPVQGGDEDIESEDSDDGLAGTEHYVEVGKGKLRKEGGVALGSHYEGLRISRKAFLDKDAGTDSESNIESAEGEADSVTRFLDPEDVDMSPDDGDGDIDSDAAFGESDSEKFKDFTFRGSSKPKTLNGPKKRVVASDFMSASEVDVLNIGGSESVGSEDSETDEDILDVMGQHADVSGGEDQDYFGAESFEDDIDQSDDDSSTSGNGDGNSSQRGSGNSHDEGIRRAELRKIMNEEQKAVVDTISQAAKADARKGEAVKQQRKVYDSLLNIRIRLQKALIATNSMSASEDKDSSDDEKYPYQAAEEAAMKLWNTLDEIRYAFSEATNSARTGQKRKRVIDSSTTSSTIWERMQSSEISTIDIRQTTLDKWSTKVRGVTTLPSSRKLNPSVPQQTITSVLQDQVARSDHLVKRTKIPRSCAPVQAKLKVKEAQNIYDDADFYQLLLKELVDQRMMDSSSTPALASENGRPLQWAAVKDAKTKKTVDTKASKGRKMRFTVHEKLQNFMAPENRGTWEQSAVDRFFGTLLGQKMTLGEDSTGLDVEEGDEMPLEEESLMLFRSQA